MGDSSDGVVTFDVPKKQNTQNDANASPLIQIVTSSDSEGREDYEG